MGKAVVFGGAGFLGSHVADALTKSGYQVRVFDIVPSPYLRPGQESVVGDIMDLAQVCKAIEGCDYVFHFAGIADINEAHLKPIDTARLNVVGTIHTLEGARLAGVKRYVFASSVYVYSDKGSFYRASKQSAERFIETYQECYGLNYTILRYGSLYGMRADKRNGIYRLLHEAIRNRKIVYNGNGEELREYIHVEDAASSSVEVLGGQYENQHIVLTGNEKLRVKDLLKMISEILGGIPYECSGEPVEAHYTITPYAFNPKAGKKLINTFHTDMGQGLIDCMGEIHHAVRQNLHSEEDWLLENGGKG